MLILAGVTIALLNEAGILKNSESAANKYEITDEQDVISVAFSTVFANSALNDKDITPDMLQQELNKTTRDTYVTQSTDTGKENLLYITFDKTKNKHSVDITNGRIDYVGPISPITDEWIKTAPITMKASPTDWTNQEVTVTIEYTIPSDKTIQADKIILEYALSTAPKTWIKYQESVKIEENMTVYARLNYFEETTEKPASLTITNIDKIPPTIAITPNGGNTYTMPSKGTATLKATPTVSDQGGSGVCNSSLQYIWTQSETEPTDGWQNFTNAHEVSKTDISQTGNWYLWTKYNDNARNNTRTTPVVTKSNAFIIGENTKNENKITLTATPTNWTNGNVTVTATYGSHLTQDKTLTCNGTNETDYTVNGATNVIVKTNGKTVTATAKDAMGNMITASLTVTNIDKTPPTVPTVNLNGYTSGSWTNQNVKVTLSSTDVGSGLEKYQYSQDNGKTWGEFRSDTISYDFSQSLIYRAIDKVGNISGNSTPVQINVDKTKPVVTTATATTEAISFTATDAVGVTAYAITTTNTAPSTGWQTVTSTTSYSTTVNRKIHNSTYYIWAKDAAGNISASKLVKTGKVPTPTTSDLKNTVTWKNEFATVTFTTTLGFSMQISTDGKNWNQPNPITVKSGTSIYVRYSDGTNQGEKFGAVNPILKYHVVYRPNGGTGKNITDSNRNYDTTYQTRPANTFSRDGHTFAGWKCNGTTYAAGANYSNLTITYGATVYMDAQWTINKYTVTIARNNTSYGTVSTASVVNVPHGTTYSTNGSTLTFSNRETVTASATAATGYTTRFSSWSSTSGTITGATTIMASFSRTANTYTITYYGNGGQYSSTDSKTTHTQTFTYGNIATLDSGFYRVGHTQTYWNTNATGTGTNYEKSGSYSSASDLTLYAIWSVNQYTLRYNANGGSGGPASTNVNYNADVNVSFSPTPTKANSVFLGWSTNSAASSATYTSSGTKTFKMPANDVTLYAVYHTHTDSCYHHHTGDKKLGTGCYVVAYTDKEVYDERWHIENQGSMSQWNFDHWQGPTISKTITTAGWYKAAVSASHNLTSGERWLAVKLQDVGYDDNIVRANNSGNTSHLERWCDVRWMNVGDTFRGVYGGTCGTWAGALRVIRLQEKSKLNCGYSEGELICTIGSD